MPVTTRSQSRSQSRSPRGGRGMSRGREGRKRKDDDKPKLKDHMFKRGRSADKSRKLLKTKGRGYEAVKATSNLNEELLKDAWNLHDYSSRDIPKCNPTGRGRSKCKRERNPVTGFCELKKKCIGSDVYSPIIDKCVPLNYVHSEEKVTSFVDNVLIPTQSKLKRGLPIDLLEKKKRYGFMDYKNVEKKR
jgi:hypothetical protein